MVERVRIAKYCLLALLLAVQFMCTPVVEANTDVPSFPINQVNKKFDSINLKLATENLQVKNLRKAVEQLEGLQSQAKQCVSTARTELERINALLMSSKAKERVNGAAAADIQYLNKKKASYEKQLSQCRLFVLRAQESINAFNQTIQTLATSKLLERKPLFWQSFDKKLITTLQADIQSKNVSSHIGFDALSLLNGLLLVGVLVALTLLGFLIRFYANYRLQKGAGIPGKVIYSSIKRYVIPLLWLLGLNVFWQVLYPGVPLNVMEYTLIALLIYTVFEFILALVFYPPKPAPVWLMKACNARLISKRLSNQLLVVIGCVLVMLWQRTLIDNAVLTNVTTTIAMSLILISLFWTAALLLKLTWFARRQWAKRLLVSLLWVGLVTALILQWTGFHNLTNYIVVSGLLTIAVLSSLAVLIILVAKSFFIFNDNRDRKAQIKNDKSTVKQRFGLEIKILKFVCYVLLIYFATLVLLDIWEVAAQVTNKLISMSRDGFAVASLRINPLMILLGIAVFSLLSLSGKFLTKAIINQKQFRGQQDIQATLSSLTHYLFFTISLLIGMLVAGVNFTGLAIIAGALSVGIGLGLQDIVNNFVSGIILLLERTVKPGDRIIIGDKEGYVKKVNVRYTHVYTVSKEDVIVPNAELVTNQVTNYMLENPYWRVECSVGVAYGSDIELVIKLLQQAAAENKDVVNDDPTNLPRVLFVAFAESSLSFELWCVIRDVNKKYLVISDLNIAIDKLFRQHNVTIAFPQRDIHITQ